MPCAVFIVPGQRELGLASAGGREGLTRVCGWCDPPSMSCGASVPFGFLVAFRVWLGFLVGFQCCLILFCYCSATVLLEGDRAVRASGIGGRTCSCRSTDPRNEHVFED